MATRCVAECRLHPNEFLKMSRWPARQTPATAGKPDRSQIIPTSKDRRNISSRDHGLSGLIPGVPDFARSSKLLEVRQQAAIG